MCVVAGARNCFGRGVSRRWIFRRCAAETSKSERAGKCIDPKVHNLRHAEIRVSFHRAARKNGEALGREGGVYVTRHSRRSPGWVKRYHPHMEGSASRRKPHGAPSAPVSRPATAFSMNLSAFVKCADTRDTHDGTPTRSVAHSLARSFARTHDRFINVILRRILEERYAA